MGQLAGLTLRHLKRGLYAAAGLTLVLGFSLWLVPLPERLNTAPSTVVTYRDGSLAHAFLAPDDRWRIAVDRFWRVLGIRVVWHYATLLAPNVH